MSDHGYDMQQLTVHTIYRLANTPARRFPFKHFLLEDFLDPELFRNLRALDTEGLLQQRVTDAGDPAENKRHVLRMSDPATRSDASMPGCVVAMTDLVNQRPLVHVMIRMFEESVKRRFPFTPPVESNIDLIEDHQGYQLAPHTDVSQKLVTCLIYLAEDDADPMIGTELYALRGGVEKPDQPRMRWDRADFVRATTAPYRPNTALIFSPGPDTFHGVSPFTKAGQVRKLMQFQINIDKPAYNEKLAVWQAEQDRKTET
ncbi:MAG: 2OG-Fe(II) oxygenase [Alphaproteobacteria bacterium]|nr:2OG-Fe(II) oxygenase [Alphaproteobacteria bacterium]